MLQQFQPRWIGIPNEFSYNRSHFFKPLTLETNMYGGFHRQNVLGGDG